MTSQKHLFDPEPAEWEIDDAASDERQVATVVFPDAPLGEFDYLVPPGMAQRQIAGCRVRVPLGKGNRTRAGWCIAADKRPGSSRRLKEIKQVVDQAPLLSPALLRLAVWMAERYLCPLGQAVEGMVPSSVKGDAGARQVTVLSVPTRVAARITQLELPAKQAHALEVLAAARRPLTPDELAAAAGCTLAPIHSLRKRGLVESTSRRDYRHPPPRDESAGSRPEPPLVLHAEQQQALDTVVAAIDARRHETVLLHGVTGSGKTEVYIRAIEEVVSAGRQAIVLVPEISLTPQTTERFRARFERVAVLHSRLSNVERHGHWRRIAEGDVQVVVGARSAVFAPTARLGLIVLDEEHDASFKQDQAPRYHARDVALARAQSENAPLVLGSATPSLESWRQAQIGRFRLVSLPDRVLKRRLPDVAAIDLRTEFKSRFSRGAISRPLHLAIGEALREGGQAILLLNRRGFATHIQCPACGHVVVCPECDIALTHHREQTKALCHYCDFTIPSPAVCPECNYEGIRFSGIGTQRLEAEIKSRFPDYACLRMDSDTMKGQESYEAALSRFRCGEIQILLGTQMIAKGLDFPNVTLVGVVNADTALHLPDFRAAERTFQLVTQVAGRTGRGDKGGRVLVQTFSPEHPAIQAALSHDFHAFARTELPEREEYGYPPLAAMIRLVFRGPGHDAAEAFAREVAERIRGRTENLNARILGPAAAPIARLRGLFRFHLLVTGREGNALRDAVRRATENLSPPEGMQWIADVDPQDML